MLFVNAMVMVKPEVFIGSAAAKFDESGQCTDDATRRFVAAEMEALKRWTNAVKRLTA
jgi:chromate reductase